MTIIVLCRDIEPGKLHDLRSASVNNTRLAIITAWHRLHPFLRYFSTRLFGEIAQFVGSVKDARKGKLPPQLRSSGHAKRMEQVSVPQTHLHLVERERIRIMLVHCLMACGFIPCRHVVHLL